MLKDPKKAIELADSALQQALDKIDELGEEEFRDAKSIIELLKENLTLWKEEEEGGNDIQDLWATKIMIKRERMKISLRIGTLHPDSENYILFILYI